ncbi:protein FAM111A-like isoform X2 [Carassius auratus]|uniref:Protein FAM111A-like isoform X2 n=1 Tax=Carassius auratus TaxID=7957 RepID=A0A6P6MZ83_CARAU|nr:protein FAM111A-like isoform X2 [Carassius auratus]XP_026101658.1 protein FAM111A-like isoform X2 [Carassius auratus]XP_052454456.1 serine protease FAM111A isoform X2 [Carassius gibelio]
MADLSEVVEEGRSKDVKQEVMDPLSKTEVEEGSSKDVKQREQMESFCFHFQNKTRIIEMAIDTSMTVIKTLMESLTFKKEQKNNVSKEIIIQRSKGKVPGAAVKTDFPCCLIEPDDNLEITFIQNTRTSPTETIPAADISLPSTDLVTFYIKTTGGKDITYLMKNNELRKIAEYVCVYALKGVEVETALKHDGRFIDKIFNDKQCLLFELESEFGSKKYHEMSKKVEYVDGKKLQIIDTGPKAPGSQTKQTKVKNKSDVASAADSAQNDPGQRPNGTEQKQTLHNKDSTSHLTKWPIIPDSEEILKILRDQHKYLLKTLLEREDQKNNSPFQLPAEYQFFRAEYDKSVQSFSEVYKIKQLMTLSDSVCQIRVEGSPRGTGFLLFGGFVLTNAHVIKPFLESPAKLSSTKKLEAAFDFERLDSKVMLVPVKEQLVAYCYITDANKCHLDFALLELKAVDKITGRPELLRFYSPGPPPNRGEICIVGHPDGGIKKTDPCFIIEGQNLQENIDKHISKNISFIPVMTQRCFEEKWDVYKNQINYNSCFFHGSSGSPVFDEHCYLIGMHSGGYVYPGEEGITRSIVEYAYSMQPIIDMIRGKPNMNSLDELLNTLEANRNKSNESGPAEQENQTDSETE